MAKQSKFRYILVVSTLLVVLIASSPAFTLEKAWASDGPALDPSTQFYVAKPNHGAIEQIADLTSKRR